VENTKENQGYDIKIVKELKMVKYLMELNEIFKLNEEGTEPKPRWINIREECEGYEQMLITIFDIAVIEEIFKRLRTDKKYVITFYTRTRTTKKEINKILSSNKNDIKDKDVKFEIVLRQV
jgi:hypothetical protein